MDDLKKLTQSFVQAAAQTAGPASSIPELSNYFKAAFFDPIVKAGSQAGGALSSQKGKEADDADEQSRQARAKEIGDELDPSKYKAVRKTDGGFDFMDPKGNKIDVNTYAQRTGQRRVDVLKDSENPIDQEYVNDWTNANELAQAMYNNDTDTVASYTANNPDLKNKTPAEFMSELIKKYPHMYGRGSYGDTYANRNKRIFAGGAGASASAGGGGAMEFS